HKKDGIFISQDKYVEENLKKFGFTEVKTASTRMETQKPLLKDKDGEEVDVHMYRSMISSLMYLTSSRLDIMFAVCACARYQVNPKVSHLHAVKSIFRYLKGQPKLGLWYPKDSLFDLVAYTDSDYAGASLDRKPTIRGCQFLRCILISWQCKKLTLVASSTTKANSKTTAWNEFSSTMASAIICLATNQKFNFTKYIFESMARNLDNVSGKFLMYPRKPKRKDTQVPQPSGPTDIIIDEVVHKELGDSLVRAATTASSLEVEQDNEVLDLENTKTTQANEIASLKRKVKKLEQKKRSRTHRLKRLRKGRRINDIDEDEDITLVNVKDDTNNEMFDVGTVTAQALVALKSVKSKVKRDDIEETSVRVSAASASTKVSAATTTIATILTPRKGIVITELGTPTIMRSSQRRGMSES
ncbi:hypothetical protein Tco_1459570, partial [Tanacetum coccineum]